MRMELNWEAWRALRNAIVDEHGYLVAVDGEPQDDFLERMKGNDEKPFRLPYSVDASRQTIRGLALNEMIVPKGAVSTDQAKACVKALNDRFLRSDWWPFDIEFD